MAQKYIPPKNDKTGGEKLGFFIVLIAGIAILFFLFSQMKDILQDKVDDLRKTIAWVKSEYNYARITILKKGANAIEFELSILGIDGEVKGKKTLTLPGNDIYLESRMVVLQTEDENKTVIFPYKVYTERIAPKDGVGIQALYVVNNFPQNYNAAGITEQIRRALAGIYETVFEYGDYYSAVKGKYIMDITDVAAHQSPYTPFESGKTYSYILHPNGGVEMMEGVNGSK
jgi:hypothetical protein